MSLTVEHLAKLLDKAATQYGAERCGGRVVGKTWSQFVADCVIAVLPRLGDAPPEPTMCVCRKSDAWKCAREQRAATIACPCPCHHYVQQGVSWEEARLRVGAASRARAPGAPPLGAFRAWAEARLAAEDARTARYVADAYAGLPAGSTPTPDAERELWYAEGLRHGELFELLSEAASSDDRALRADAELRAAVDEILAACVNCRPKIAQSGEPCAHHARLFAAAAEAGDLLAGAAPSAPPRKEND